MYVGNIPAELVAYREDEGIPMEAYSPIALGEIREKSVADFAIRWKAQSRCAPALRQAQRSRLQRKQPEPAATS